MSRAFHRGVLRASRHFRHHVSIRPRLAGSTTIASPKPRRTQPNSAEQSGAKVGRPSSGCW